MANQIVGHIGAIPSQVGDKHIYYLFGVLSGLGNELPYLNVVPGFGVFELLFIALFVFNPRGRVSFLMVIPLLMSALAIASLCFSIYEGRQNYGVNNLLYGLRFSFFSMVVFYFSGAKPSYHLERVARGFLIGAALQGVILWAQWFTEPRFFLGMPTLAFSTTFINPNSSGYLMSLGFLLAVSVKTNRLEKIAGAFLLLCILATLSKGAWLTCSIGLIVLFRNQLRVTIFLVLLSVGVFFETLAVFVEVVNSRVMASSGSNEHRMVMVERTILAIQDYPFLGVGPGAWPEVNKNYGLSGESDSHNVWMNLSIENGLFQGALFFAMFLLYGYCAVRIRSNLAFVLFCHFTLYTLLIGLVYSDRSHWLFMSLLFGFLLNEYKNSSNEKVRLYAPAEKKRALLKT